MTPETAQALERLERKWRDDAGGAEINALEADSIGLHVAAKFSEQRANLLNECADELATLRAQLAGRDGEAAEVATVWREGPRSKDWRSLCEPSTYAEACIQTNVREHVLRLSQELDDRGRYNDADVLKKLVTRPAPAVVLDAAIDRAIEAYHDVYDAEYLANGLMRDNNRTAMRAALTAALTEGGSRE